jgi:hypothetical protein
MDGSRFDDLTRSLTSTPSRRTAVRLLAGSALGLLGSAGGAEAAAHNALTKCKRTDNKQKRKKCLKRARRHNAGHNESEPEPEFPGTCTPEQEDLCETGDHAAANCNDTPGCSCYTTARGARFCGTDAASFCPEGDGRCRNNADCGEGAACVKALTEACGGCTTDDSPFCIRTCTSAQICSGEDFWAGHSQVVICGGTVGDTLDTCFCFKTAETGAPVCVQFDPDRIGNCSPASPCPEGRICVAGGQFGDQCFLPCANPLA